MIRFVLLILFIVFTTGFALSKTSAEGLHEAYTHAKEAEAKEEYHRVEAEKWRVEGIRRWGVYIQIKTLNIAPKKVEAPSFDIYKLAEAVAHAETNYGTKGYGLTHNNMHGIRHGNTVPCPGVPKGHMCKFETKQDSIEAFVVIRGKRYKRYPDWHLANKWTGGHNVDTWLKNVAFYYNK